MFQFNMLQFRKEVSAGALDNERALRRVSPVHKEGHRERQNVWQASPHKGNVKLREREKSAIKQLATNYTWRQLAI